MTESKNVYKKSNLSRKLEVFKKGGIGYWAFPNDVRKDGSSIMGASEKQTYMLLFNYMLKGGIIRISSTKIANALHSSVATVERALDNLFESNWLDWDVESGKRVRIFHLLTTDERNAKINSRSNKLDWNGCVFQKNYYPFKNDKTLAYFDV